MWKKEREGEGDLNQTLRLNLILGYCCVARLKKANTHWPVIIKASSFIFHPPFSPQAFVCLLWDVS